ncbi:hypothetical protein [Scytonema sp. NUACC26]|uniref:hypothetical protein n=1 Tax=Scytonema sp. NUACC26 TaxID=3140176 RepID=UPI0034DCB9BC
MNSKLVHTLIEIIRSLSPEERNVLTQELLFDDSEPSNQEIIKLAEMGSSFNFLNDEPDIYTLEDGEPV